MKDIEFFSKITRAATHDLKNVFASIKECAGLMEDLLNLGDDKLKKHISRIRESLNAVKDQLERGNQITSSLNKFVHSVDQDTGKIDATEILTYLITLIQRIAKQKQTKITLNKSKGPAFLQINPFGLYLSAFMAIMALINISGKDSEIVITPVYNGPEMEIRFEISGKVERILSELDLNELSQVASENGFGLNWEPGRAYISLKVG